MGRGRRTPPILPVRQLRTIRFPHSAVRRLPSAFRLPLSENALRQSARVPMSETMPALDPQTIAERVRDGMFPADAASHGLGLSFLAVGPGCAKMTMTIRADMLNGIKLAQGGFITALADAAFAYACNSYNEQAVASGLSVDFAAPAHLGDVLTAEAKEVFSSGRTGIYDVAVTNQQGKLVAVMRGKSHRLKGHPVVAL